MTDTSRPTVEALIARLNDPTSREFNREAAEVLGALLTERDDLDRMLAAHDAEVRSEALSDASDWARSCSGESADVAADYIDEMAASSVTPAEYKMPGFDGTLEALSGLTIRQTGADR